MVELISSPWYIVGATAIGVLTGVLMAHRDQNANEVGLVLLIVALMTIITAPYPTKASWLAYVALVAAGWVAGVLFLTALSDSLSERSKRRVVAQADEAKKKQADEEAETWSAV